MIYLKQKNKTPKKISVLAKVEQLTGFDMIYVYHLLSIGTKVSLKQIEKKLNGDLVYSVSFNTFKLGFITLSNFSKILFDDHLQLNGSIFGLSKEKYLPIKSLEISITKKEFKMVS